MTYATEQAKIARKAQWLVEIILDRCAETYTQGACTASDAGDGSRCHYSFPTCQDPANFNKSTRTLYFCLNDVTWPDPATFVYPLLRKYAPVAQKIASSSMEVYPAKISVEMAYDFEPAPMDHDKGSGFYNTARTGEFWRNLIARNRNYAGRSMRILRGFDADGFTLAMFQQVGPSYKIKQIKRNRDSVTITGESVLAYLKDHVVPLEVGEENTIQNAGGITALATAVTVADGTRYPDPTDYSRNDVYVGVDTEIMELESIAGNVLTVRRGALGTSPTTHQEDEKVKHVLFIGTDPGPGESPTGVTATAAIQDLLEWCGISSADVATSAFTALEEGLFPSEDIQRILWSPKAASKLMYQLREPRNIALFLNSSNKWAVAVPAFAVSSATLTESNFVEGKSAISEDEEDRATRVAMFYEGTGTDPGNDPSDYSRGVVHIDASLEQANNYGEVKQKVVVDPWLWGDVRVGIARNQCARLLTRARYGTREWSFDLELVDGDLEVGDQVTATSSLIVDRQGTAEATPLMISSKKERNEHVNSHTALDPGFSGPYFRIGADSRAEAYATSAAGARDSYWADTTGRLGAVSDEASVFF